jgi:hypothetical protein
MTWNFNMSAAPRDRQILGLCRHEPDTPDGSLYAVHYEGLSHVEDGPHVLVWGGAWSDSEEDGGGWLPDWWFQFGSEFEVAANPIAWMAIPIANPCVYAACREQKPFLTGGCEALGCGVA